MPDPSGMPIWYELVTSAPDAAAAFYADVIGWTVAPTGVTGIEDYRILAAQDGGEVAGLMPLPDGARPGWFAYFGVEDVDAAARRVEALGGTLVFRPQDIPGVGRFVLATDPQGLPFYLMRRGEAGASNAFDPDAPGHVAWNELVTSDHAAALAFYDALLGWESREAMPMGPLGEYCFIDAGETRIGATMTASADMPRRWSFYVRVPSIGVAVERVKAAGGSVDFGPMEVPGGDIIIMGTDPQGVAFALVGQA